MQARQQSAGGAAQLAPAVTAKLRSLQGLGIVGPSDFDSLATRCASLCGQMRPLHPNAIIAVIL